MLERQMLEEGMLEKPMLERQMLEELMLKENVSIINVRTNVKRDVRGNVRTNVRTNVKRNVRKIRENHSWFPPLPFLGIIIIIYLLFCYYHLYSLDIGGFSSTTLWTATTQFSGYSFCFQFRNSQLTL